MEDEELLETWHSLRHDRQVQLAAILRYMAGMDAEEELDASPETSKGNGAAEPAPQQRFYPQG